MNKIFTLAIPVKNEESNIIELESKVNVIISQVKLRGFEIEVLINDNGSTDGSEILLRNWSSRDARIILNVLNHPISFQQSIQNMMKKANGDLFSIYQSDMQDPSEMIISMIDKHLENGNIVGAVITERDGSILNKLIRKSFYIILTRVSDSKMAIGLQDFYVLPKDVYKDLAELSPEGLFLRGHIASRFGKVDYLPYKRFPRISGKSNFNFAAKYTFALDGILLFGTRMIRMISVSSFIIFTLSLFSIFVWLLSYTFGFRAPVKGFTSLIVGILVLISLIGMAVGLILEYLISIYRHQIFDNRLFTDSRKI